MSDPTPKTSRPRRYALTPCEGFANPLAAHLVASLDELSARHFDLIEDLPPEIVRWVPAEGWLNIAQITAHMAGAEAHWIGAVTGEPALDEVAGPLRRWKAGEGPLPTPAELVAASRRVRDEVTKARLAPLPDLDVEVAFGDRVISVRGVLAHLVWHWTYHNGQTGLICGQCGWEHQWAFDSRITGP